MTQLFYYAFTRLGYEVFLEWEKDSIKSQTDVQINFDKFRKGPDDAINDIAACIPETPGVSVNFFSIFHFSFIQFSMSYF